MGEREYPVPIWSEVHYRPQIVASMLPELLRVIDALGGDVDDAKLEFRAGSAMPDERPSVGELGAFLAEQGVRHFTAGELTRPNHPSIAHRCGYTEFVAPRWLWPVQIVSVLLADCARRAIGAPINCVNAWRPQSYNAEVADSTIRSDHPNAAGLDLVFRDAGERAKAEGVVRGIHAALNVRLRLGLGHQRLHVGAFAPQASASWVYKGYRDGEVKPWTLYRR